MQFTPQCGRGLRSGICLNTQPIKQTISELLALSPCWLTQRRGITLMKTRQEKAFSRALFTLDRARHYSHLLRTNTQRSLFKLVHTIEARDHSNSQRPRATTQDMGVTSKDAPFIAPCDSWTMLGWRRDWGGWGGQRWRFMSREKIVLCLLCWRQSERCSVTALWGVAREPLSSASLTSAAATWDSCNEDLPW